VAENAKERGGLEALEELMDAQKELRLVQSRVIKRYEERELKEQKELEVEILGEDEEEPYTFEEREAKVAKLTKFPNEGHLTALHRK
jgi:hypothetical protein